MRQAQTNKGGCKKRAQLETHLPRAEDYKLVI